MDKTIEKLIKKYGVSEKELKGTDAVVLFDMSGRTDFLKEVQNMDIKIRLSEEKNAQGGMPYVISANLSSLLGVLGIMISKFGPDVQLGLFIAAAGSYVVMTAAQVSEYLIQHSRNK